MIFAGKLSGRLRLDIMFGAGGTFGVLLVRAVFGVSFGISAVVRNAVIAFERVFAEGNCAVITEGGVAA